MRNLESEIQENRLKDEQKLKQSNIANFNKLSEAKNDSLNTSSNQNFIKPFIVNVDSEKIYLKKTKNLKANKNQNSTNHYNSISILIDNNISPNSIINSNINNNYTTSSNRHHHFNSYVGRSYSFSLKQNRPSLANINFNNINNSKSTNNLTKSLLLSNQHKK